MAEVDPVQLADLLHGLTRRLRRAQTEGLAPLVGDDVRLTIAGAFEKFGEIRSMGQSYFTIWLNLFSRATRKLTRALGFGETRAEG